MDEPKRPSGATPPGRFDRFAAAIGDLVARGWFFAACAVSILVWAISYPLWGNGDTFQLVVNTGTTIITFLLLALLHNTSHRSEASIQRKLNAIAEALIDIMEASQNVDMPEHVAELRAAVGLEHREGT